MDLKIGDVVRLKSCGPKMTVCEIMDKGVKCIWFHEGSLGTHVFLTETLDKLEKNSNDE